MERSLVKSIAELGFALKTFSVLRGALREYFLFFLGDISQATSNLFGNKIGNLKKIHMVIKFNEI